MILNRIFHTVKQHAARLERETYPECLLWGESSRPQKALLGASKPCAEVPSRLATVFDATGTMLRPDELWTPSSVTPVAVHASQKGWPRLSDRSAMTSPAHGSGVSNSIPSSVYDILADAPAHSPCATSATYRHSLSRPPSARQCRVQP